MTTTAHRPGIARRALALPAATLVAGVAIGFGSARLLAGEQPQSPSGDTTSPQAAHEAQPSRPAATAPAARAMVETPPPQPGAPTREPDVAAPAPEAVVPPEEPGGEVAALVRVLRSRLEEEASARLSLETEVEGLRDALAALDRDVGAIAAKQEESERRARRWRARPAVNVSTLVEAGYEAAEAEALSTRWGEQEMAELYLRDQAAREGWRDSERYTEALSDLRRGPDSFRSNVGEDEYDAFLYAIGRSNRLLVEGVLESSPAQGAGLEPGDVIRGYDGTRIYSWTDLREAMADGEPDFPVAVEIERDGQLYEVEMPRGPLGVRLDSESVQPE